MAHFRLRHLVSSYQQLLKYSPLIGIFGHRQVGKKTFLEAHTPTYFSLDQTDVRKAIQLNADNFLMKIQKLPIQLKPISIDECQLEPNLFPALKEFVRLNKKPGQIILSGSVRFYSRKAIRESLTGRIMNLELLPLNVNELSQLPPSKLAIRLLKKASFDLNLEEFLPKKVLEDRQKILKLYSEKGGLPGICFLRNERLMREKLSEQLNLILERDIRLIYSTSLTSIQIRDFIRLLAQQELNPFTPTTIRKELKLAEATQLKLLQALEAVFVLRLMSIEGDRKGLVPFFEDQAEQAFLNEERVETHRAMSGLIIRNLYSIFNDEIGLDFRFFQFRKRPNIVIPYAVKTKDFCMGFLPIEGEMPTTREKRMAEKFLQHYNNTTLLFVSYGQPKTKIIYPRAMVIPCERLLFEE